MIWVTAGPFQVNDWWVPDRNDPGWHCTREEMALAMQGSFMIDMFYDDGGKTAASDGGNLSSQVKIGGINGFELNDRLNYYKSLLKLDPPVASTYALYDLIWSAADSLYRTFQRMDAPSSNLTLERGLSAPYNSTEYGQFSAIYIKEISKTKFTGATVSLRD